MHQKLAMPPGISQNRHLFYLKKVGYQRFRAGGGRTKALVRNLNPIVDLVALGGGGGGQEVATVSASFPAQPNKTRNKKSRTFTSHNAAGLSSVPNCILVLIHNFVISHFSFFYLVLIDHIFKASLHNPLRLRIETFYIAYPHRKTGILFGVDSKKTIPVS